MATNIKFLIDKLIANPKRLFLMDGIGALSSAIFLILIRLGFEDAIGMPRRALYFLALVACACAIYSFCCYFFIRSKWRTYLKAIAIANIFYCCLTIGLLFYFYQSLTTPGIIYFLLEVVLISSLIRIEGIAVSRL